MNTSKYAENLSQDLLELLFSKEMAQGCSIKSRRGDIHVQKLDIQRIHAFEVSYNTRVLMKFLIRDSFEIHAVHLAHSFPAGPIHGPEESSRRSQGKKKRPLSIISSRPKMTSPSFGQRKTESKCGHMCPK